MATTSLFFVFMSHFLVCSFIFFKKIIFLQIQYLSLWLPHFCPHLYFTLCRAAKNHLSLLHLKSFSGFLWHLPENPHCFPFLIREYPGPCCFCLPSSSHIHFSLKFPEGSKLFPTSRSSLYATFSAQNMLARPALFHSFRMFVEWKNRIGQASEGMGKGNVSLGVHLQRSKKKMQKEICEELKECEFVA